MDTLVTSILRNVLGPSTDLAGPRTATEEPLTLEVFSPIELLREGHDRVDSWSPKSTLSPDDRDAGYLLVLRPGPDAATADAAAVSDAHDEKSAPTTTDPAPLPHHVDAGPALTTAVAQRTEQSAFAQDPDGGDAADVSVSVVSGASRRSPLSEEDTRLYTGSLPTSSSSRALSGRPSAALGSAGRDGGEDAEEEEELLAQNRVDWSRRAAFVIWVSAHFLSSRSPHLLRVLNTTTAGGVPHPTSSSAASVSPAPSSTRYCLVPVATLDLWSREFQRARNQDVLFCDAVCIRPSDVVAAAADTVFVTARDRRIQALTLAVSHDNNTAASLSPTVTLAPVSSAFMREPSEAALGSSRRGGGVGGSSPTDADVSEYCFAFHTGGLTRFVTALRSLLAPRIVRDMMLQQAASVNSIQVTQASAAVTGTRPVPSTVSPIVAAVSARFAPHSLASLTPSTSPPRGDDTAPVPAQPSRRHGTWRTMSKWANASLQKMKESWQAADSSSNPLQDASRAAGETEESEGDVFDIPTSAVLRDAPLATTSAVPASHAPQPPPQSLVPVLAIPPTSGLAPVSGGLSSSSSLSVAVPSEARHNALAPLSLDGWLACFLPDGSLDTAKFSRARQRIFYGGAEACVRQEVWRALLDVYPSAADTAARLAVDAANAELYAHCSTQWQSFTPAQLAHFQALRTALQAVEKDVARTDRNLDAYRDDQSPKLQTMQRVLMAHVMVNVDLGYSQGMSDVLSPLALLCDAEDAVFLLFRHVLAGTMRSNFSMDTRTGMPARLRDLQAVVRHFFPPLYAHLRANSSENMMFCFRWILMAYKREFALDSLYTLWDVLFAAPPKSDFDLVVAAGLLKGLGPQLLRLHGCDRIVMFANNLNGNIAVEDAIWYAHDFYNQMCVEYARLASLRAGSASTAVGVTAVSVHDMAGLCLFFDGPLPTEEL